MNFTSAPPGAGTLGSEAAGWGDKAGPQTERVAFPYAKRRVIVESPYAGDVEQNVAYARRCLRDCFLRGEAPFASHLLYTQPGVLSDADPAERAMGIEAGLLWGEFADATVVYMDRGLSPGMMKGVDAARSVGRPVEYRSLPGY